jgi:hypothetical protein
MATDATLDHLERDEALDIGRDSARYSAVARVRSFSSARSTTRCGRDGLSDRLVP